MVQPLPDLLPGSQKGDSVYKAALSDTIYLVKANGSRYKFTFDKLK